MARKAVVTGAGSGIGAATAQVLRDAGYEVLGVDLKGADVSCDITDAESLEQLYQAVESEFGGSLDALVANAGVNAPKPITLAVNYFGTVAGIEKLQPLLAKGDNPRVSVTASAASLQPYQDDKLIELLLAGDKDGAMQRGAELAEGGPHSGYLNYSSSKRAIARWIRRESVTEKWAGAGIALNGVGPGVVETPMTEQLTESAEGREQVAKAMPAPLNGFSTAKDLAEVHKFLVSAENTHMAGQILYVDGGYDVLTRGDDIFGGGKF